MSSLALMRLLESAPRRYDAGMRWLTLGRVDAVHEAVAQAALVSRERAPVVLEIGCGTGALTERLCRTGARVTALDQNPEMLEIARERLGDAPGCELMERTAAEIDRLPAASFDAVVSTFALSEMSRSERCFVLARALERLRAGGVLVVADEVHPAGVLARVSFWLLRLPQAIAGWIAVGSVSRPIAGLREEIEAAGFRVTSERRWLAGQLAMYCAGRSA